MAAQTGRTHAKFLELHVDDSGGTLRQVTGFRGVSNVGMTYDTLDVTALADAIKNNVLGHPDAPLECTFVFDNTASTGSHIVLAGIVGGQTPLALDLRFGIRHTWESGEPTFGITGSSVNGYLCASYTVNPADQTCTARFVLAPGSAAPAWATTAHT
jgi:hypothetical protein